MLLAHYHTPACLLGRVTDVHFTVSPRQPKLIAIAKHPNDDGRHLERAGKADHLAGSPRDPGPQRPLLALALLHVPLARMRLGGSAMPGGRAPRIGGIAPEAQRLEQPLKLHKHVVWPPAQALVLQLYFIGRYF
jgi:hypothetical protein